MPSELKVCVALTFDFDAMSGWIGTLGEASPSMISRGEFAAVAVPRVLELLDRHSARATFFVPGHTALAFPVLTRAILDQGHEIGHHGWIHENPARLSREEELHALKRGLEALDATAGVRPSGYRSPGWDHSPNTVELLLENGFAYDSSLMADDYTPYWCRVGDRWSRSEPFEFGTAVNLAELPVAWHLDDLPHFEFIYTGTLFSQGLHPPASVYEIWRAEFDYLYQEVAEGVLTVTLHPEVIGRGHRLSMLNAFLEYVSRHDEAQFVTCAEYVRDWRQHRAPEHGRAVDR